MEAKPTTQVKLKTFSGVISLTIDFIMIVLVILNLAFVIFDWSFDFMFVQERVKDISEDFFVYYHDEIYPNFLLYDSIFIGIFISELFLQWFIAIIAKTYSKWWLYPFAHWYDVLGCIPAGTFLWFRLFRIFAMTLRLHKMGVINLRRTHFYNLFYTKYQLFAQDIADRSLIKLIEAAQRGVKHESKEHVVAEAIKPHQAELAKVLSEKIQSVIDNNYHLHEDDLKDQIQEMIQNGFDNSESLQRLQHIPLIGTRILQRLENLVSDVSFQMANSLTTKLASDDMAAYIENVVNTSLETMIKKNTEVSKTKSEEDLNDIVTSIIDKILQEIKEDIDRDRKSRMDILGPESN